MNKRNKTIWRVYERDRIYPQNVPGYLDMLFSKTGPYVFKYFEVICFSRDYFWWARDSAPIEKKMRLLINSWLDNKKRFEKFCRLFDKSYDRAVELRRLADLKFSKLTNLQLYQAYNQNREILLQHALLAEYPVDLFDDCFAKTFEKQLVKISRGKISEQDKKQFLQPAHTFQAAFYKKKIFELSFKKSIPYNVLKDLVKKYCWIQMGWDGSNEITLDRVKNEIKKAKKLSISLRRKEIQKIINFSRNIQSLRKLLIKKYKLSAADLNVHFLLLDIFTKYHDWRKEMQLLSVRVMTRVLTEASKRFGVDKKSLLLYFNWEMESLLLKEKLVPRIKIKDRKEGLTFIIKKNKTQILEGIKAKKALDDLVLKTLKVKKNDKVVGLAASQGVAKGKAVVVKSAAEALKLIKESNILITSMTTVDYLPAIQKAAAVVTDEGGIICHAAIISRELGIPCVVGTKIATQVFKTGDKVEVDANRGIVRLILKAK